MHVKLSISTPWADVLQIHLLGWTSEGTRAETYLKSCYSGS